MWSHKTGSRRGQVVARPVLTVPRYMNRVMRELAFCICKNKDADQLPCNLISALIFATQIVQSPFFLNPKIKASS